MHTGEHVEGDGEVIRMVASNLLGNAHDYAPPGSTVECRFERHAGSWRLVVQNDAPEMRAEDIGRMGQPFWRRERARADGRHSGLGLALSKALAEKVGMELSFVLADGVLHASLNGPQAGTTANVASAMRANGSASVESGGGA